VPTAVLETALADPEAETYQFVFTAVKTDGNYQTSRLAERSVELQDDLSRARVSLQAAQARETEANERLEQVRQELRDERRRSGEFEAQMHIERSQLRITEAEVEALNQTKTLRYTKIMRDGYGRLRRHGSAE
jgi:predicted  nucleic acid-binding Zn-ribbon protein